MIVKRLIDFACSFLGFFLLFPIFFLVTIILFIESKGAPFFLQKRPGKTGRMFFIIKFKTMSDKKNEKGILLPDSERLTKLGKIIRKTSLDEIPQLLNVIKGDMSLVGPRPLLPEYLPLYTKEQMRRHEVKPGITGWAQVNGRNAISWKKKFELDVWYVKNQSFLLDVKILLLTVKKVFTRDSINQQGSVTTSKFEGNIND